ncbi:hypothetical protein PLICRDRAFT_385585 [Plicaturopsis crispa FD-325 SS-3]|nr:hypothetical protein PLICRDRAFT_385585 [Plicaturopsis crispa FD-325 SS-3]
MPFGILDDKYLSDVPGTAVLSDLKISHGHHLDVNNASALKRGTGRHSHVVLVPQPSDDPADPLNWPRWKKEACFWTLAFTASLDGALSPMMGPGYQLLAQQFNVSVDEVASTFGAILLGLGCFMLFQAPLAVKFGHRIVYLISVTLMFVSCVWCALSPNIPSITASRVFQGFGMSALQTLVGATIEQMFFVHERGARSGIWSFSIMAGITAGPLICGYVIQNLSWQMGFWFVSIALGMAVLMVFFLVPETTYDRTRIPQARAEVLVGEKDRNHMAKDDVKQSDEQLSNVSDAELGSDATFPPAPSYASQLKIWNARPINDTNIARIFLRPFSLLWSPVTWFIFLTYGMTTVWLSLLPICSSTIFTIEYGFNASQTGLTNIGGLVGIILAMAVSSAFTDRWIVWISRRNEGIYEPEFRLFFTFAMLFGVFGYAGWAVGNSHSMPWIGAVICITLANFSIVVSGSATVTYLLDTHGTDALHSLAITNFFKNMVIYALSFFINGIVASRGVETTLLILAGCQAFCWLSCIPMYIYGKRVRSFIARHPQFFLRTD